MTSSTGPLRNDNGALVNVAPFHRSGFEKGGATSNFNWIAGWTNWPIS